MTLKRATVGKVVLVAVGIAMGQTASAAEDAPAPAYSVTLGVGNSVGWFGMQMERYLPSHSASVFFGGGYLPQSGNVPGGPAAAAGARVYRGGLKHRAFAEASVSEVLREWWVYPGGPVERAHRYGPGAQLGYVFVGRSGLTLTTSAGLGYAIGAKSGRVHTIASVTLGYTGRRPSR